MAESLSWNLHGDDRLSAVLDRLDRSLTQVGRQFDHTTAQARQMGAQLGRNETMSTRFQSGMRGASGSLDGLASKAAAVVSWMRTMAVTAGVALIAAGTAAGAFGIKMAAANETAAVSFKVLLGSADQARAFLEKLQAFAASTPFEFAELRTTASRLLAAGIAADKVIPLLTRIGDATAAMGTGSEGIQRAVYALQQMRSSGRATLEDLNQLSDAGVFVFDALSASIGVTQVKLREMVSRGEISADQVFTAIETAAGTKMKAVTGIMAEQSKTMEGIWSSFKDNASIALASFVEPAMPGLKRLVDATATAVPAVLDKLKSMGNQVTGIFKGSDVPQRLMDSLTKLKEEILPRLSEAWDKIVGTVRDNREGLEKLGRFVADVIIPLIGVSLVASINTVTAVVQGVIWALGHAVDAVRFFATYTLNYLGFLVHAADNAFGWIPGLGPKLHEATAKFDAFGKSVLDKLNALDGKTVDVNVRANLIPGLTGSQSMGVNPQKRARGGPNDKGWMLTSEQGPELWYSTQPGMTKTASQTARSLGGADDREIAQPIVIQLEGSAVWQGMLRFKSRTGKLTLGLA